MTLPSSPSFFDCFVGCPARLSNAFEGLSPLRRPAARSAAAGPSPALRSCHTARWISTSISCSYLQLSIDIKQSPGNPGGGWHVEAKALSGVQAPARRHAAINLWSSATRRGGQGSGHAPGDLGPRQRGSHPRAWAGLALFPGLTWNRLSSCLRQLKEVRRGPCGASQGGGGAAQTHGPRQRVPGGGRIATTGPEQPLAPLSPCSELAIMAEGLGNAYDAKAFDEKMQEV